MSVDYRAVQWNPQKKRYDLVLLGGVSGYLAVFAATGLALHPHITIETLLIRAFGTAALILLHVILCIGPLCRLDPRFLPLLYNRRHLGVTMFALAFVHATFATLQFHALGDLNPLVSVLVSNPRLDSVSQFPFELFGAAALMILAVLAATSHDFWLANLTAPVWKALHMGVYAAYGALILHVALGVMQSEPHALTAVLLGSAATLVIGLHLVAGAREVGFDRTDPGPALPDTRRSGAEAEGWVELCGADEIPDQRARIFPLSGERIAVFRYGGKISALSNVCQHQNGPLGEGRIVDGCVTCPWHGYQYLPASGRSPEPFTEQVPTFSVRVIAGRVWVDPRPHPPGTPVVPATWDDGETGDGVDDATGEQRDDRGQTGAWDAYDA